MRPDTQALALRRNSVMACLRPNLDIVVLTKGCGRDNAGWDSGLRSIWRLSEYFQAPYSLSIAFFDRCSDLGVRPLTSPELLYPIGQVVAPRVLVIIPKGPLMLSELAMCLYILSDRLTGVFGQVRLSKQFRLTDVLRISIHINANNNTNASCCRPDLHSYSRRSPRSQGRVATERQLAECRCQSLRRTFLPQSRNTPAPTNTTSGLCHNAHAR